MDYLGDTYQFAQVDDRQSDYQGNILGPPLFNI